MSSSLNVPDGQPLVWALNALGHSLRDRVYGPELMARAFARAAIERPALLPVRRPRPGRACPARLSFRGRFPGMNIVGGYAPPFRPLSAEERSAIVDEINESEADVVWVGIGVPKQEKWMAAMRPASTRRCSSVSAPRSTSMPVSCPGAAGASGSRARMGLPARPGTAPAVATLLALQPPVRDCVRAPARGAPINGKKP